MMTVSELIEYLKEYPMDMPVIIAEDDEGNHYSTSIGVDEVYVQDINAYDLVVANAGDIDNGEYARYADGYGILTRDDFTKAVIIY